VGKGRLACSAAPAPRHQDLVDGDHELLPGFRLVRRGRPLAWDAAAEQFVGDEAANRLLYRPYRAPWSLPG